MALCKGTFSTLEGDGNRAPGDGFALVVWQVKLNVLSLRRGNHLLSQESTDFVFCSLTAAKVWLFWLVLGRGQLVPAEHAPTLPGGSSAWQRISYYLLSKREMQLIE